MSGAVCSVGVFVRVLNSKGNCLSSFEHDPVENDKGGWQRRSWKNKIGMSRILIKGWQSQESSLLHWLSQPQISTRSLPQLATTQGCYKLSGHKPKETARVALS